MKAAAFRQSNMAESLLRQVSISDGSPCKSLGYFLSLLTSFLSFSFSSLIKKIKKSLKD